MQPLLIWLLASLVAIALMGSLPYLALAVVLGGGIAMGLSSLNSGSSPGPEGNVGGEQPSSESDSYEHSTDGSLPLGH